MREQGEERTRKWVIDYQPKSDEDNPMENRQHNLTSPIVLRNSARAFRLHLERIDFAMVKIEIVETFRWKGVKISK